MRTWFKTVALGLAGWAGAASAVQAVGPICDENARVVHTTYNSCDPNQGLHGSLHVSNETCGVSSMRGMLVGAYRWNVVSHYASCSTTPQTPANYVYVTGNNGYSFYQYHHSHNVNSYTRTCDRCVLGLVGTTAHGLGVDARSTYNGTNQTAWYSGYVTCGSKGGCAYTLGYPRMS